MRVLSGVALVGIAAALALAQLTGMTRAQGVQPATAKIQVSGSFKVEINLQVSKSLPDGTQITVQAAASAFDSSYSNSVQLSGTGQVSAGKMSLTLTMPYTWLVASTADKVTVSIYITGGANAAAGTYYDNTSLETTIALPANNATTTVPFSSSI